MGLLLLLIGFLFQNIDKKLSINPRHFLAQQGQKPSRKDAKDVIFRKLKITPATPRKPIFILKPLRLCVSGVILSLLKLRLWRENNLAALLGQEPS